MKLITRNTDYAIRALCVMAESNNKKIFSVSELVKKLKIPRPFLRKILQILNKKRILKSYKGQGGGFSFAIAPSKIFLVDLIRIFQGQPKLNNCSFIKNICPAVTTCRLKRKIDTIERYVLSELRATTITSLLNGRQKYGNKKRGIKTGITEAS